MAMEELKKLQDENNLLLEEIQVLETEMQGAVSVTNIFRLRNYMDDNVKFHLQQSNTCWSLIWLFYFRFLFFKQFTFHFSFLTIVYRGKLHAPNIRNVVIYLSLYFYIFHFLMGLLSGIPLEAAQSSSFSELLLRIDDLRKKVVTNRSIWYSPRCRRTCIALAWTLDRGWGHGRRRGWLRGLQPGQGCGRRRRLQLVVQPGSRGSPGFSNQG